MQDDQITASQTPALWERDAFDRRSYADFLTRHLLSQTKKKDAEGYRSFCMALDAGWGAGKTYFVKNWTMQLQTETTHPAFRFDAWASDYQADPTVAFMAAFKGALDQEISKLPIQEQVQDKARSAVKDGIKELRRAILPISKAVLKGVVKKALPGALEEITNALEDGKLDIDELDFENVSGEALEGLRGGLDRYFEESLKEQAGRGKLLDSFRLKIADALNLLHNEGKRSLPFFVFVDEIDRCRPSFAVELLEELKHIFNIPGLCFVVSTNIEQLAHAVSAVYGVEFDGRGYLQRFFDSECALPYPSMLGYAKQLVDEFPLLNLSNVISGLPREGFTNPNLPAEPAVTLEWVAQAFALDLRSQRRLVEMMSASISSIESRSRIHLLWLAVLSAARIKSTELFDRLSKPNSSTESIRALWAQIATADHARTHHAPGSRNGMPGSMGASSTQLSDVAVIYYATSWENIIDIFKRESDSTRNVYDYPGSVLHTIMEEMPAQYTRGLLSPLHLDGMASSFNTPVISMPEFGWCLQWAARTARKLRQSI